jgi:tetratricopeptide (TPR) repeat protein
MPRGPLRRGRGTGGRRCRLQSGSRSAAAVACLLGNHRDRATARTRRRSPIAIRGNARADAGANGEALADFDQAVSLRPDEVAGFAGRAPTPSAVQDFDGAIADYGEVLRLAPGTVSSHIGRGHAHFVRGDTIAAIVDFTEAIRLNPKSASTYNRRWLAYRRSGDLARAIDDYTTAIGLNAAYALAYNNRGYVYEAQGRKSDAIADFKSALFLDPSLIGARDGLKRLGAAEGLLAVAEARVRQGKSLVEKNCSPCHAVGTAGDSPNKKAPPFRSLHARHPSLALREPLSRGIAAPHDEMPHFALSPPEIDSIVAYINSLAPTKAPPKRQPTPSVPRPSLTLSFAPPRYPLSRAGPVRPLSPPPSSSGVLASPFRLRGQEARWGSLLSPHSTGRWLRVCSSPTLS